MSNRLKIIIPIIATIIAVVIALVFYLSPGGYRSIRILEKGGIVTFDRGSDKDVEVYDGLSLTSGDVMRTADESFARMNLDDAKYVYMEQESEVSFGLERGLTTLDLTKGAIVNEIEKKLETDEVYEVKTPNSLMSVRGTRFRVSVYRGDDGIYYTRFSVMEGVVECRLVYPDGSMADETVSVEAGREAIVFYDETKSETDYVKFDGQGVPVYKTTGDVTRDIKYDEMPIQVLEYLITRLGENPDYADITIEDVERAIKDSSYRGEPTISKDLEEKTLAKADEVAGEEQARDAEAQANAPFDNGGYTGPDQRPARPTPGAAPATPQVPNPPQADEGSQPELQPGGEAAPQDPTDATGGEAGPQDPTDGGDTPGDPGDGEASGDDQDGEDQTPEDGGDEGQKPDTPVTPSVPDRPYVPPYNPVYPGGGGNTPSNPVSGTSQADFENAINQGKDDPKVQVEVKDGGSVALGYNMVENGNVENPITVTGQGSTLSLNGGSKADERLYLDGGLTVEDGGTANVGNNVNLGNVTVENGGTVNINGTGNEGNIQVDDGTVNVGPQADKVADNMITINGVTKGDNGILNGLKYDGQDCYTSDTGNTVKYGESRNEASGLTIDSNQDTGDITIHVGRY